MGIPGSANPMLFGGAAAYQINQSLRFNSSDSTYLNRTPGSTSGETQWTCSLWVKFAQSQNTQYLFWAQSGSNYTTCEIGSGQINFTQVNGGSVVSRKVTSQLFRDFSAWYHLVIVWDSANATASERMRLYVNGSRITAFATDSNPPQNHQSSWNQSGYSHTIGKISSGSTYFDGYIAEFNHVSGQALTAASFGETDTITGAWIPKKYSGSYGTNGFYLKFESSGIGTDSSGNGNTWTASGFSTSGTGTDVMSDTPTNNFATYNPLVKFGSQGSFSDGNLASTAAAQNSYASIPFFASTTGKYYVEFTANSGSHIAVDGRPVDTYNSGRYIEYQPNGNIVNGGGASGASFTTNDIIGVAIDMDNLTVAFYKNNSLQATVNLSNGSLPGAGFCVGNYSSVSAIHYVNFGQRAFAYTPPTGFKALNTANLPEPTIKKGGAHFNTVLYTGNDSNPRQISGVGFQPDWVWIKCRSEGFNHVLCDRVRGTAQDTALASNTTSAESSNNNGYVSAYGADSFTVAAGSSGTSPFVATNANGRTYVAWNWKANGAGSSNTAGTITSTVSANATAGFSIVTWTGTSSVQTVGHGLGVTPAMIIVKNRSAGYDWYVGHKNLTSYQYRLTLNSTSGQIDSASAFNSTSPTSTVFTVGNNLGTNGSGNNMLAYCFSEVAGYSKFGSYVGNGSTTDGVFVYTGFKPALIITKASSAAGNWNIYDDTRNTYNPVSQVLYPDLANAEDTLSNSLNFLSNGFKLGAYANDSGTTFIYAAFSETAFKYSNAR